LKECIEIGIEGILCLKGDFIMPKRRIKLIRNIAIIIFIIALAGAILKAGGIL